MYLISELIEGSVEEPLVANIDVLSAFPYLHAMLSTVLSVRGVVCCVVLRVSFRNSWCVCVCATCFGTRSFGTRSFGTRIFGTRSFGTRIFGSRSFGTRSFGTRGAELVVCVTFIARGFGTRGSELLCSELVCDTCGFGTHGSELVVCLCVS